MKQRGLSVGKKAISTGSTNAAQLGLVCTYRGTGSISSATFGNTEISNSAARRYKAAKTFIDLKTDTVYSDEAELAHAAANLTEIAYEAREWDSVIRLRK